MHIDLNTDVEQVQKSEQRYNKEATKFYDSLSQLEKELAGRSINEHELERAFYRISCALVGIKQYLVNEKELYRIISAIDEVAQDLGYYELWCKHSRKGRLEKVISKFE